MASCLIAMVTIRFANPELTETQLLIRYWREWLLIFIGFCGVALTFRYELNK